MRALEAGVRSTTDVDLPSLAARLGATAPGDAGVQAAADALGRAASRTSEERNEAIRAAMRIVSARATRLLVLPARPTLEAESLLGHVADDHAKRGRR
ncbi:MAG: hypothetical protein LC791_14595 [Acidobacteria bacterium]|nr:hypothetical protein [Acidobacteriota bacterium]